MIKLSRRASRSRLALAVFLGTAAPVLVHNAHAEADGATPASASVNSGGGANSGAGLETITVTARKTKENLQDTPISISVFSGGSLEQRQISSVSGIDKVVPNLVISETAPIGGSSASASYFIRGIGQTDFTQNTEPGVGIYVDGVYIARSVGSLLQLVDVDSIEVLRGPQGTLFGRNTIGGAISLTTRKPSKDLGGDVSATLGSDMLLQFKGTLDAPISDKILTKVTFFSRTRNGYLTRASDGIDLGNENKFAVRGDVRLLPTDDFTIDISIEKQRNREHSAAEQLLAAFPDAAFPAYNNNVLQGATCGANPAAAVCYNSQWVSKNGKDYGTGPAVSNADVFGLTVTATWQVPEPVLGSDIAVKTITAWRSLDSYFTDDHDHSPIVIDRTADYYNQRQFSQEFQITGTSKLVHWAAGAYYFHENGTDANYVDFSIGSLLSGGAVQNNSLAGYGQATINLTQALSVTGGIRHTSENKNFIPDEYYLTDFVASATQILPAGTPQVLPGAVGHIHNTETNFLGNVSYKLTRDIMVYANYSDGFKSGGFTQRLAGPPFIAPPAFAPEYVKVYEAGLKSELFDRRLRLNLAAFQTDYKNIQLNVLSPGLPNPFTMNAAKARIRGAEGEASAKVGGGFDLNASLGYLDAKYLAASGGIILQTVAGNIPVGTGLVNLNSKFVNAPKWTLSTGLSYTAHTAVGKIVPRIDWSYRSDTYLDALNTPQLHQSGYGLWNAGISYTDNSALWTVSAGMKDIFDKRYLVSGYADTSASGLIEGVYNRGREWQVEVRRKF